MAILSPSWTEPQLGPIGSSLSQYSMPKWPTLYDYPRTYDRQRMLSRSKLELAILANLRRVARALLPDAIQYHRRLSNGTTTVYLDHGLDPIFPGKIVYPGYWIYQRPNLWDYSSEAGSSLVSLYAHIREIPDFLAEDALRSHLNIPGLDKLEGWAWEKRPLVMPPENPNFFPDHQRFESYLGITSLPILYAVKAESSGRSDIRYFSLWTQNEAHRAHWVEALPPGELPLFSNFLSRADNLNPIRILPSEFDPGFERFGNGETYYAVPGGAACLARTDLSALAGRKVHYELLPDELAYAPDIVDALSRSKAAEATVSLVGEAGTFPLERLREIADRHGHSFPLPALPEPMMSDNALTPAGSAVPTSEKSRRFLLTPVIPEGGLVWLYAREKVGKTWLALAIADAVSRGVAIGPWKAKEAAKTVYIDGEMHPDDLDTAIAKVTRGQGNGVSICFDAICAKRTKRGAINLAEPAWREEIKRRAKGKSLLILDNFYSLTNNSVGEFPEILDFLQQLRAQGIAVVVIDHTNREGGLQGAHTKERAAETVIEMRIPEGRSWRENVRAVEVTKARHYIPEPADYFLGEMVFTDESFRFDVETLEIPAGPEPIPAEIAKLAPIMIAHDIDKLSFPKIQERLGTPRSTASDWHKKAKRLSGADREALDREIQRLLDARKAAE